MRPRDIDSSPTPSSPPPSRATGNISSMVVRPSDDSTGGGYRGYNPDEFERRIRSPTPRRRGFQRSSPTGFRRHSPTASPAYRPYRSGNLPHASSISPPARRPRLNGSRSQYDGEYSPPHYSHGYGGGRGRGRFRNMSPPRVSSGFGRANGGRLYGRGYELDRRQKSPFEDDEFDGRNDPNISPREGDWICINPRCGNLNFARRSQCNNCDQPRIAPPGRGRFYSQPWRSPPPNRGSSPLSPPPPHPPPRRNFTTYNTTTTTTTRPSPPPPPPPHHQGYNRREGKFDEYSYYRGGRRGGRSGGGHWDEEREAGPTRRAYYDRREASPLPRGGDNRWIRKRSRSPVDDFRGTSSSSYRGAFRGRGAFSSRAVSPTTPPGVRKHSDY